VEIGEAEVGSSETIPAENEKC